jgi:hypothetical protein
MGVVVPVRCHGFLEVEEVGGAIEAIDGGGLGPDGERF